MPSWLIQFVAAILLASQAIVSVAPARLVLCFGRGQCEPAITTPADEPRGCCPGCADQSQPPSPAPDAPCPGGCGCCLDVGLPPTTRGLELSSASADLHKVLIHGIVCTLAALRPLEPDDRPATSARGRPPDRPALAASQGLLSTRLII